MKWQLPKGPVDTHCHLADTRWNEDPATLLDRQRAKGVGAFVMGGVDPADWERQLTWAAQFPGVVYPCFGLHPYFVADNSAEACEQALVRLEELLPQALAMGEIGLDYRGKIAKGSEARQLSFFSRQLEMALGHSKALVLHIVRAHSQALKELKRHSSPRGFVHAFNSNLETALAYQSMGLFISVGGALHPGNKALYEAVRGLPLESLLLESDSPDQAPPELHEKRNEPWTIHLVARHVADIKGLPVHRVLEICHENLLRLFSTEFG